MNLLLASALVLEFGLAFTHHTIDRPGPEDWNEVHPSVTLSYEDVIGKTDLITGVYHNSEDAISFFVGIEFDDVARVEGLSLELGAVTGYASADVLPMARLTYDVRENAEIFLFPIVTTTSYGGYKSCVPNTNCTPGYFSGTDYDYGIGFGINFKFNTK